MKKVGLAGTNSKPYVPWTVGWITRQPSSSSHLPRVGRSALLITASVHFYLVRWRASINLASKLYRTNSSSYNIQGEAEGNKSKQF